MSRVYVEPTAILLGGATPAGVASNAGRQPSPGAIEAIDNLREARHDVLLFVDSATIDERWLKAASLTDLPIASSPGQQPGPGSWLVTADPRQCEQRPAGVHTIQVGPRRPPAHGRPPVATRTRAT